jgi:large subunit ribosomal protein L11
VESVEEEANYFVPLTSKGEKMAKRVAKVVKMELPGGDAKPGPKLASAGVVMPKFCTEFNAKTADRRGQVVPVIITAYEDKTFSMEIKTSPVTGLLLKAAGIEKGSANQHQTVGKVTKDQVRKIAEYKLPDLNTDDIEQAMKIVEGSARNMGIQVVDK